jgi:hypothetical protein
MPTRPPSWETDILTSVPAWSGRTRSPGGRIPEAGEPRGAERLHGCLERGEVPRADDLPFTKLEYVNPASVNGNG